VAVFQLATAPVAAHMVGRSAYRTRRIRRDLLIVDELGERLDEGRRDEGGGSGAPGGT
jgi:multicomponent Na+:H+ antiporter subunit G